MTPGSCRLRIAFTTEISPTSGSTRLNDKLAATGTTHSSVRDVLGQQNEPVYTFNMMTTVGSLWVLYAGGPAGKERSCVLLEVIDIDPCQELGLMLYKHGSKDCI